MSKPLLKVSTASVFCSFIRAVAKFASRLSAMLALRMRKILMESATSELMLLSLLAPSSPTLVVAK